MKRLAKFVLILIVGVAAGLAAWIANFAHQPLPLPQTPFEFKVRQGASLRAVARQLAEGGVLQDSTSLWMLGRILDRSTKIHAGTYRLEKPLTPLELLDKLGRGDVVTISVKLIEGNTFADLLKTISADPNVKQTLTGQSPQEILRRIGATESYPEGLFFPDTYHFAVDTTDLAILRRLHQSMRQKLTSAWEQRVADLPYKSPYEVLIMASIIEKETGRAEERALIASVFLNRLRIGMRLQTDPTVIYGMGSRFDGNIRKRDLTADTPYNTYTRDGLPPTPIAMPGWGSLIAAVKPEVSDKLYFVGKGDGTHYFSRSLEEHNRAVAKYQLRK